MPYSIPPHTLDGDLKADEKVVAKRISLTSVALLPDIQISRNSAHQWVTASPYSQRKSAIGREHGDHST